MTTISLDNTKYKAEIRQKTAKPLLWIGLISIVMFFAGLTSALIVSKSNSIWIKLEVPSMFFISTILILFSSLTYHLSMSFTKNNQLKFATITTILTFVLGISFTVTQFYAWQQLYQSGIFWAGEQSNPSGSYFYALTALHLLHLFAGLISLLVVVTKSLLKKYSPTNVLGIQLSLTYWHFLTALWVYLFFFLKFIA